MKSRVLAALLVGLTLGAAQVNVKGILVNPAGGVTHSCECESTLFVIQGNETWFVTSGWSAAPNETDTFDFPPVSAYPDSAVITATFDDTDFVALQIPRPMPTIFYQFPQPYRRITVMLAMGSGIEQGSPSALPARLSVNPSVVRDAAVFRTDEAGRLDIFDASGRVVRSFAAPLNSVWDRKDGAGRRLEAGVYFCRLVSASGCVSRKLLLAR